MEEQSKIPTFRGDIRRDVFSRLRKDGCCWNGGHECFCSGINLKECYSLTEKRILEEREPKSTEIVDKTKSDIALEVLDRTGYQRLY